MTSNTRASGKTGRLVATLTFLGLIMLLAVLLLLMRPQAAPQLGVEPAAIDLGFLAMGTSTSFEISIINTGAGTLRFERAPFIEVLEGC